MAQTVGSPKAILGTNDTFGGKYYAPIDYSGATSYSTGGDAINPQMFGFNNTILSLYGGTSQSGTYRVSPRALSNGYSAWQLVWIVASTGVEVSASTNLSAETVRLTAIGE